MCGEPFLADCCSFDDPKAWAFNHDIRARYDSWRTVNPEAPEFTNELWDRLTKRGLSPEMRYSKEKGFRIRGWEGIQLTSVPIEETKKKRGLRISLQNLPTFDPSVHSFEEDTEAILNETLETPRDGTSVLNPYRSSHED